MTKCAKIFFFCFCTEDKSVPTVACDNTPYETVSTDRLVRRSDLTDLTQKMESVAPGHQYLHSLPDGRIIRIYHECEGRIEKSVLRIAVWHHEACQVMTIGYCEGQIFLSYPHTNNGLFFLLTTFYLFIYLFVYLYILLFIIYLFI